jgi:hypothetical protein
MCRRLAFVRSDVSEERIVSIITLMMEMMRSSETSVLTKATRRHIPKDCILHIHHCESPQVLHSLSYLLSYSEV